MSDDIETLRGFLHYANITPARQQPAIAAFERIVAERDSLLAERDSWKSRAQQFQRERAELSDALNGTPCAEIRWQYERDSLRAKLERARAHATKQRLLAESYAEHAAVLEANLEIAKEALNDAIAEYEDNSHYKSEYLQEKHGDITEIARLRAVLAELSADAPVQQTQADSEP